MIYFPHIKATLREFNENRKNEEPTQHLLHPIQQALQNKRLVKPVKENLITQKIVFVELFGIKRIREQGSLEKIRYKRFRTLNEHFITSIFFTFLSPCFVGRKASL